MSAPELKAVSITDFRSLSGTIVVPLEAPIVLIHGENGAGKTSTLAALQLALTGKIDRLPAGDIPGLVHRGQPASLVELITSTGRHQLKIDTDGVTGQPVLNDADSRFFADRCYLPQAVLGRLLELYGEPRMTGESPLTAFVNELLGLDELEALLAGLHTVTHKTRAKQLVPEYESLQHLLKTRNDRISTLSEALLAEEGVRERHARTLAELIVTMGGPSQLIDETEALSGWLTDIERQAGEAQARSANTRRDVLSLLQRAETLEDAAPAPATEIERVADRARSAAEQWRLGAGAALGQALDSAREFLPGLPAPGGAADPEELRLRAVQQIANEIKRIDTQLAAAIAASDEIVRLDAIEVDAQMRLVSIDELLAATNPAAVSEDLTSALTALISHIHDDECPVCGRNFGEVSTEPLTAQVASRIAAAGAAGERFRDLTRARLAALKEIDANRTSRSEAARRALDKDSQMNLESRLQRLRESAAMLNSLADAVAVGATLMRTETGTTRELIHARESQRSAVELRTAVEQLTDALGELQPTQTSSLVAFLRQIAEKTETELAESDARLQTGRSIRSELAALATSDRELSRLQQELSEAQAAYGLAAKADAAFERSRERFRGFNLEAEKARATIVREVFSRALNAVWGDLFGRLAPEEPFIPAFSVPKTGHGRRVVATLETIHRDGLPGGPPESVLSAGNLNTAALTLFLALHLSVEPHLPWIFLDDPVQSMDEIHVSQFAAVLRTLTRENGRKIIIAIHERQLFEYLAFELSPATPAEGVAAVNLIRRPDGTTAADIDYRSYVPDRAFT